MLILPHRITVWDVSQGGTQGSKLVNGVQYDLLESDVAAQVTPMTQRQVVETMGVDLDRPYWLLMESDKASLIGDKRLIEYDGDFFTVQSPDATFKGIGEADHTSCVIQKLQFPKVVP